MKCTYFVVRAVVRYFSQMTYWCWRGIEVSDVAFIAVIMLNIISDNPLSSLIFPLIDVVM